MFVKLSSLSRYYSTITTVLNNRSHITTSTTNTYTPLYNPRSRYLYCCYYTNTPRCIPNAVLEGLISTVGSDSVSTSDSARNQHSRDESYHTPAKPDMVVFPTTTNQVSNIVKLCSSNKIPMVPFGTGTGLEGGVCAVNGGVSISLARMDNIIEVSSEDAYATVEPGVTREMLNSYIRDTGLWFPVDPGAEASICGMVATGASGTNAVRYGTMKENVLNLEVVLPSGDVINTEGIKGRSRKSSAGYNLTGIFVGSEGTLGIITKASVKLFGVPESMSSAVCSFPTIQSAVDTTIQVVQSGIPVARVEFLDDVMMSALNKYSGLSYPVQPTLFFEFHGSPDYVKEQSEVTSQLSLDNQGEDFKWTANAEERTKLWKARHNALYACKALLPDSEMLVTDVCVPISKLPEVLVHAKEDAVRSGILSPIVGHVGDGNFHCVVILKREDMEMLGKVKEYSARLARMAIQVGGTCTGEHGIGYGKMDLLEEEYGPEAINLMKTIKTALDPLNLMNPGKVVKL